MVGFFTYGIQLSTYGSIHWSIKTVLLGFRRKASCTWESLDYIAETRGTQRKADFFFLSLPVFRACIALRCILTRVGIDGD